MKLKLVLTAFLSTILFSHGQNTFIYDQQSTNRTEGEAALGAQPVGQSFTPSLPSVGFIMLMLSDGVPGGGPGGILSVNLRANSITGTILGSTMPLALPSRYFGVTNFFFSTPVALTVGTIYYFQPVVLSGGGFGSSATDGSYVGGTAFYQGLPVPDRDLWFREGIVVPEPSSVFLVLLSGGILFYARRKKYFCT